LADGEITFKAIKLEKGSWRIGRLLNSGGFAQVFEAMDLANPAVAKFVPKAPGASRELLFEELAGIPNIVPIIDFGETSEHYVLMMPRAEKSLRDHVEESGGLLPQEEAVAVLIDVATALDALKGRVVHRDIKPENVLLLEGRWCLADFGISRYADATTAPDTHKYSMTAEYAAPEQWRFERAIPATDVYSFGVMAFELLQGQRPFAGPDFRDQHLVEAPPPTVGLSTTLASIVAECLRKQLGARPTAASVLARLSAPPPALSPAAQKLQALNLDELDRRSQLDAKASSEESREHRRRALYEASKESLREIMGLLRDRAQSIAPTVGATSGRVPPLNLRMNQGQIEVGQFEHSPYGCLEFSGYDAPFDVIGYTYIAVKKPRDRYGYEGRAHSLWFCDAHEEGVFRWFELAFMFRGAIPQRYVLDPTALPPTKEEAIGALCPYVMAVNQVAWQPIPIDQGAEDAFIERWLTWFAEAVDGSLRHPSLMPENSGGHYRYPPAQRRPR
jgi:eukaryotic-like serine/threonine-protein kinase